MREREKGVLRAARPRTLFQGEYPPGCFFQLSQGVSATIHYTYGKEDLKINDRE